jgi:hypothetical protein
VDWIAVAQDREKWRAVVSTVMNLLAAYNVENSLSSRASGAFYGKFHFHGVSRLASEGTLG